MKIVICGPPHSGKSVFVQELRRRLLPLGIVGVIEGCPDGEGGWAGATHQGLVGELRRKGKFSTEFVDWVIASVDGSKMPITLVDVGGVRSPENERIFRSCDAFIVLANPAKVGELEAWEAFGRAHGCEPVALLESVLHGETSLSPEQDGDTIRGIQAGLERGQRVGGPVLDVLVAKLIEIAGREALPGELEATIHTGRLADALSIPFEERDARLGFRSQHALTIRELSQEAFEDSSVRLWGACPAWVAAFVAAEARNAVELWDVRLGYVGLPELQLTVSGSDHLGWRIENGDGFRAVTFTVPGQVFNRDSLAEIAIPTVAPGATIVLSGRGPHWLLAAIARAYAKAGHPVAVTALHESETRLVDGRKWAETNPGRVPAVMISGPEIGKMVAVPISAIKS